MAGNRKWKSFLNKFHVYGGLFSVGFLIIFSISAFYHQHHPKFPKPGDKTTYWEASFTTPQIAENIDFKKAIRDSLGLFGHTPWWEDYHDSLGVHHFSIVRPGKRYWITVPLQDDIYKVKEIRMGPWPVLIALHPLAAGMQNHGKGPFFYKNMEDSFSANGLCFILCYTDNDPLLVCPFIQEKKKLDHCWGHSIISCDFIDHHMVGRMSINKLVQKIHLITSMIMLSFMLVYVMTGIIMINRDLLIMPKVEVSHSTVLVEKPMKGDPKDYARYLKKRLDLRGRTQFQKNNKDNWIFHFNMPDEGYQVTLTPAQDTLYIRHSSQDMNLNAVVHRIHVLRGFKGGWEYTAWAVMYDTSCFAMILFAITGIIMWFKRRKQFRHGWWYLLAGIAVPLLFIYAFVLWK